MGEGELSSLSRTNSLPVKGQRSSGGKKRGRASLATE